MKTRTSIYHIIKIAMLFLLTSTVSAQGIDNAPFPSHYFRIGIIGLHYQVKDRLIAPLRWDGVGCGLRFSYMVDSPTMEHEIDFLLPVAFLSDRYEHKGYAWEATIGYTRLYRINPSVFGGALFLGAQFKWNANCQFYADWDDSHLYWLNVYDLGPALKWNKEYDMKHHLSVTMQLPLIALISRPPENRYVDQDDLIKFSFYLKALHENLKLTSVNEYFSFNLKGDYTFQVSEGSLLGFTWLFQYKSCRFPQSIGIISNIFIFNYIIIL
jgi:hypothetical protein